MNVGAISVETRPSTVQENSYEWSNGTLISATEAASLLSVTDRAIRKACAKGRFKFVMGLENGHHQLRIFLSSLPELAQAAHYRAHNPAKTRTELEVETNVANGMGKRAKPLPLSAEESESLWAAYDKMSGGAKKQAIERHKVVIEFDTLRLSGVPKMEIYQTLKDRYSVGQTTVWRWCETVRHLDRGDWLPALAPDQKGKPKKAELSPDAWGWIKKEWGSTSKPFISDVYHRCNAIAVQNAWQLPSLDTVQRRINAMPGWWRVLTREGQKELANLYPAQERDYSTMALHELWNSDGHKADLFCRWDDGTVARPIVVAWIDLRSRYCLGYEIGYVENADLIRFAFRNAAMASKALPRAALLDNGRGYASKLLTGGQKNRYRFKVKEEDVPGILTLLGIDVTWATPGHGQAKPIERFWGTVVQVAKQAQFQGAYCGNKPDAKPEDFDAAKAVPLNDYRAALDKAMEAYNNKAHRGDSMDMQSPRAMYDELAKTTPVRQPTTTQMRLCLLAAESKILGTDYSVTILGNRYWSESLTKLPSRGPYVVRFNPESAADDVAVYDGERYICDAPLIAKTGFRDQEAAKTHIRARNSYKKSMKQAKKSMEDADKAMVWDMETPPAPGAQTGVVLLPAKVGIPVRPIKDYRPRKAVLEVRPVEGELTKADFDRARARGEKKRYG